MKTFFRGSTMMFLVIVFFSTGSPFANGDIYNQVRNADIGQAYPVTYEQEIWVFNYSATDPYGAGDDGGIVLESNMGDGYWVRSVANTAQDPIDLNWFFLAAETDLTPLLQRLKNQFAPGSDGQDKLYIRLPDIGEARIRHLDWRDLRVLHLLEPANPIKISRIRTLENIPTPRIQFEISSGPVERDVDDRILNLESVNEVVIGGSKLNVTFNGNHTGIGRFAGVKTVDTLVGHGLIELEQRTNNATIDLDFNTRNTRSVGIRVWGDDGRSVNQSVFLDVAGSHWNSGVNINGGVGEAHFTDLYIADPYGVGYGFNDNRTESGAFVGFPDNFNQEFEQQSKGLWMLLLKRASGRVRLQYGGIRWFMASVQNIGNSQEDPLWISIINHHVSGIPGPGDPPMDFTETRIGDRQQGHTGKIDHIGQVTNGGTGTQPPHRDTTDWSRFLKITEGDLDWYPDDGGHMGGQHFPSASATLEASGEGVQNFVNDHVHLQVGNNQAVVDVALLGRPASQLSGTNYPDLSRNHTIVGIEGMPNESIFLSDLNQTLMGGDWANLLIGVSGFDAAPHGRIPTSDITVKDLNVRREIIVGDNVEELKVTNVNFEGEVFNVARIGEGSKLELFNPQFPDCGKIDGDGVLEIDGVERELPFLIDVSEKEIIENGNFDDNDDSGWTLTGVSMVDGEELVKGFGGWSIAEFDSYEFEPNTTYEVTFDVLSLGGTGSPVVNIGAAFGTPIRETGFNRILIKSGTKAHIGLRFSASGHTQYVIDNISVRRSIIDNGDFDNDDDSGWLLTGDCDVQNEQLIKEVGAWSIAEYDSIEFEPNAIYEVSFNVTSLTGSALVNIGASFGTPIRETGHNSFLIKSGTKAHIGLRFSASGRTAYAIDDISVKRSKLEYDFVENGQFDGDDDTGWHLVGAEIVNGVLVKQEDGNATANYVSDEFEFNTDYEVTFDVISVSGRGRVNIRGPFGPAINRTGFHRIFLTSGETSHIGLRFTANGANTIEVDNIQVRYAGEPGSTSQDYYP